MRLHLRSTVPAADASAGTVVFLHGFPFDGSMWAPQLEALPDGWRGLAPDLRGFGRSDLHDVPGEVATGKRIGNRIARGSEPVLTMARHATDIADLIDDEAGGRAVVCGLSMGGYVAFELLRRFPDRIRGLVLCDTRAGADDDEGRENRLRTAQSVRSHGLRPLADTMIPALLSQATRDGGSDVVDRVRHMILHAPPATVIAALAGMAARHDSTGELGGIEVPTLVIVGSDDTLTPPADARGMADAIPGAELVKIPDAGHLSNLEQPAAFNDALGRFLTRLPPLSD